MIYLKFKEKYGNVYYCAEAEITILKEVLKRRIEDAFVWGENSIWYDDLTNEARSILESDDPVKIRNFMYRRRKYDYEDFEPIHIERLF